MDGTGVFEGHLRDLAERSYNNSIFTFTNFLGEAQKAAFSRISRELSFAGIKVYGGMEYAERVVVRFGNEEELGYTQDFPIKCLMISPVSPRYSQELGHRDFLGSLMGMGIERELLGDIIVRENTAFLFCMEHIAEYICENLIQVRHTNVRASVTENVPEDAYPHFRDISIIVTSARADAVVSKVFNLSRSNSQNLFKNGKVFVNGEECMNISYSPAENDIISVRGFGKFIFAGQQGFTGKGRCRVLIRQFT